MTCVLKVRVKHFDFKDFPPSSNPLNQANKCIFEMGTVYYFFTSSLSTKNAPPTLQREGGAEPPHWHNRSGFKSQPPPETSTLFPARGARGRRFNFT